ncbi:hypothetical protein COZ83_01410 [Candidatus Kaiserbacteria bacterium CG_4_8_14_3_um_filter_50_23]|uniref:Uncharacterized protein n=1 Tax=Candidatus Kaiserbacteria bacterium CG17_big_fil_post_rev_8_21_14_2_50_51_7 TaxID=1974613 RepID=A0A2M7FDZ2_9BACT|nr:MAG: hypothetical protein COW49_01495 [Candidatus Kaiserbacteria bacterium CG17_big_fil_post_rev_8_21_14_2_50_51_7]PIW96332.1 MAG: hypothetical protein COZ83_01410 [Candidatus Kaiserbacteria bacterium CG_4_8_14_3_um_filter_50_23]PJA00614.1 MAG: hypothetical protein COX76_01365 [Candidatus Kaiserbacteria bacterium CG_4_10_14_0_2_um_filter_50_16]
MNQSPRPNLVIRIAQYAFHHFFIVIIIILALVGTYELDRMNVYRAHPELASAEQATEILKKVGDIIQLPQEQPTMAIINDAASAKKEQPFLKNAANGDVLIVYPNAGEALMYRPSSNKLIAVGPVDNSVQDVSTANLLIQPGTVSTSTNNE